jgi:hypothetical protein
MRTLRAHALPLLLLAGCSVPIVHRPEPTYLPQECTTGDCDVSFTIEPNNTDIRSVALFDGGVGYALTHGQDGTWKLKWPPVSGGPVWGMNGDLAVTYRTNFTYPGSSTDQTGTYQVPVIFRDADTDHDMLPDRFDPCPFIPKALTPPGAMPCDGPEFAGLTLLMDTGADFIATARDNSGPAMFTGNGVTFWAFEYIDGARMLLSNGTTTWPGMTSAPKAVVLEHCKLVWSDQASVNDKFVEVYAAAPANVCSFRIVRTGAAGEDVTLLTGDQVLFYVVTKVAPGFDQGRATGFTRVTLSPPAANAPEEARGLYDLLSRSNRSTKYIYFVLEQFKAAATVPAENCGAQGPCVTARFQGRGRLIYRIPPP